LPDVIGTADQAKSWTDGDVAAYQHQAECYPYGIAGATSPAD
jgi:hypothetical protein